MDRRKREKIFQYTVIKSKDIEAVGALPVGEFYGKGYSGSISTVKDFIAEVKSCCVTERDWNILKVYYCTARRPNGAKGISRRFWKTFEVKGLESAFDFFAGVDGWYTARSDLYLSNISE